VSKVKILFKVRGHEILFNLRGPEICI
jgi:hypothetical protein